MEGGWRPIESAEIDRLLVVSGLTSGVGPGRWVDIGRCDLDGHWHGQYGELYAPTHWLPLPAPPA